MNEYKELTHDRDVQAIGLLVHVLSLRNGESLDDIYTDLRRTLGVEKLTGIDPDLITPAVEYLCGRLTLPNRT